MSNMLNKETWQYLRSVNTADPKYADPKWVTNPDLSLVQGAPTKYWGTVVGVQVQLKDAAGIAAVDLAALPQDIINKVAAFKVQVTKFLVSHYSSEEQSSLGFLLGEANSKGYTNRKAAIQPGIDWLWACLTEYYSKKDLVKAATTPEALAAIELDLSPFIATDPGLKIEVISAIVD